MSQPAPTPFYYADYLKLQYANPNSYVGPNESLAFMKAWLAEAEALAKLSAGGSTPNAR